MVRQTQQFLHDLSPGNKKGFKINVCNHVFIIYFFQNHKRKMKNEKTNKKKTKKNNKKQHPHLHARKHKPFHLRTDCTKNLCMKTLIYL